MAHVVSQFEKALHKSQTPTKMIAIRRNERNHRRVILDFLSELAECMVRRVNAREKFRMKESLRQCIRPLGGECSPGLDEIRRVPVL